MKANNSITFDYGSSGVYPVAQKQQEGYMNKMTKGQWLGSWGFMILAAIGVVGFFINLFYGHFWITLLVAGFFCFKSGYDSLKKYRQGAKNDTTKQ